MRFILFFIVSAFFSCAYAQENYAFIELGQTEVSNKDFNTSATSILGLGRRFDSISLELAYLYFGDFNVKGQSDSYIELQAGRFSINGHLDIGWPELVLGAHAVYYDASAQHANALFADKQDTTFGLSAGLLFALKKEWGLSIKAGTTKNILKQDFQYFTIGLQKEF